jgi:hypothetical protein
MLFNKVEPELPLKIKRFPLVVPVSALVYVTSHGWWGRNGCARRKLDPAFAPQPCSLQSLFTCHECQERQVLLVL